MSNEKTIKILEAVKTELAKKSDVHVAIVAHENPDPDALGAAVGMEKLIHDWFPEAKVTKIYSGEISHAQNKTMMNVLGIELVSLKSIESLEDFADYYICVDATPDRCFPGMQSPKCLLVVDHHRNDTKMAFHKDIRSTGATSSIVWEYLHESDIHLDQTNENDAKIATALLVGIKTDTSDLVTENVTELDFEAFRGLLESVNRKALSQITNYQIPTYHFELRSRLDKEDNVRVKNGVFIGGLGIIPTSKRDALPIMAEERARSEGVETAFIFAIIEGRIDVSVRSVSTSVEINGLCQKLFGAQAGGKQGSGAARIPMGFMDVEDSSEDVRDIIWAGVKAKMFETIFQALT